MENLAEDKVYSNNEKIYFAHTSSKFLYFERWESLVFRLLIDGYNASNAKRFMSFDQFKEYIFLCTDEESIKYIVAGSIKLP